MKRTVSESDFKATLRAWSHNAEPHYDAELEQAALYLEDSHSDEPADRPVSPDLQEAIRLVRAFDKASRPPARFHMSRFRAVTSAAALAAAIMLFVFLPKTPDKEDLRPKGVGDQLSLAVERAGRRFTLPRAESLRSGDRFGLFYSAEREGYLAVYHQTQSGQITSLYGADGQTAIASGYEVGLSVGGRVDTVEGCEWVVALFFDTPIAPENTRTQLKAARMDLKTCRLNVQMPAARSIHVISVR